MAAIDSAPVLQIRIQPLDQPITQQVEPRVGSSRTNAVDNDGNWFPIQNPEPPTQSIGTPLRVGGAGAFFDDDAGQGEFVFG